MLQKLDLAALAEEIENPYRPALLAALGTLDASLFVCDDKRSWHRNEAHDQLMLVLEGVITLDGPGGRTVVNEGEVAAIPGRVGHGVAAGMRSSVVLFRQQPVGASSNGHQPPPEAPRGELGKVNVAASVHAGHLFDWLPAGTAGNYAAYATRLWGESEPYTVPAGSLIVLVYRGVLDYTAGDESAAIVGSQMLVAPPDTRLTLRSERGATVLAVVRAGMPLPQPAPSSAAASESGMGGEPGP